MNKNLANNYEAVNEIAAFRKKYMDVLQERITNARKILDDPNYKWKSEQEKKASQKKFDDMQVRVNDYNVLYDKVLALAREHEELVDLMGTLYMEWRNNVSFEGQQQKEMMQSQAEILQKIFVQIYDILSPLCLNLPKPKENELKENKR